MQNWMIYIAIGLVGCVLGWVLVRVALRRLFHWRWMRKYGDAETVATMMDGQIARGMTVEMVIDVWGTPADMDEVVMKTKTKRELKYDQKGKNRFGTRVYFENGECVGWETK